MTYSIFFEIQISWGGFKLPGTQIPDCAVTVYFDDNWEYYFFTAEKLEKYIICGGET